VADQPAAQSKQMNQKFAAAIAQKDTLCYVRLSGVIDEDNGLTSLIDQIPPGFVAINLAEIERINSCGVRDWVTWLNRLERAGGKVVLTECSPAIVAQINLVHNFTAGGAVKSFYAPYFCPACDLEKVLLIEANEMAGQPSPQAPTCRCDECDGVMDFDDMEESYFAFLGSGRKFVQNAKIDALLNEFSPGGGRGERKIRSRTGLSGISSGLSATPPPAGGSLPSVPSLPSGTRTPTSGAGQGFRPPTNPGLGNRPATGPGLAATAPTFSTLGTGAGSRPGLGGSRPNVGPFDIAANLEPLRRSTSMGKPTLAVVLVVGLLLIAIGLLAYAIFLGPSHPKVKIHGLSADGVRILQLGPR
jgi:anti-anti-sigma regulatory factor